MNRRSELGLTASRLLLIYAVFVITVSDLSASYGQISLFPKGRSLSLTIWGAGLAERDPQGVQWDAQSPPDSLVRVYLGGRLIAESGAQRDTRQPMWALTVGPLTESAFSKGGLTVRVYEQDVFSESLIEELLIPLPVHEKINRVDKTEGLHIKPLIYQWIDSSTSFDEAPELRVGERRLPIETQPSESLPSTSEANPLQGREQIDRTSVKSAKRSSAAAKLYRAYLKAQFSGDQLQEHRILLKLVQRYGRTRHGRKARRLLLLDGR